jgi:hypothetical protein
MVKDLRVKQFIEAVEQDCGKKLDYEEAAKILNGITSYLLTLEKIYMRMQNNINQEQHEPK